MNRALLLCPGIDTADIMSDVLVGIGCLQGLSRNLNPNIALNKNRNHETLMTLTWA